MGGVDLLILDARTPVEFAFSHLSWQCRSRQTDQVADLELITTLPRDRPIVVCCSDGVRSAARFMN
ncbi:rhodanese-like domain-containing protein [Synechococcus sp. Cruz CV-v-12]|uniref:rhodanese-like domain-containing protein n=1 Tax=unclassified Synechococcus TaxID=2626047 RepID=UPI0037D9A94C